MYRIKNGLSRHTHIIYSCFLLFTLASCQAAPTRQVKITARPGEPTHGEPTHIASATPTALPPPSTPTRLPSATPDPQKRLQTAAQQYLAPGPTEAAQVARQLDFLGDQGHPSNMCGPLAIAILRDAGYLPQGINLHDFWLFKPGEPYARRLMEQYFPSKRYEHIVIETPLNQTDWRTQPLLPGDFIFIHAGRKGDFSHMLVVTRADVYGRPYTVTNYRTSAGFVIQEQLLYDQFDPTNGLFYQWIRADSPFARTGLGGIEIWRPRP